VGFVEGPFHIWYTHTELPLFFLLLFCHFLLRKREMQNDSEYMHMGKEKLLQYLQGKMTPRKFGETRLRKNQHCRSRWNSKSPSNKHAGYVKIMGLWAGLWKTIFYITAPLELKLRLYTNCICEFKRTRYI
jgi:hypothetical protein